MQLNVLSAATAISATMIIGLPCRLLLIFLTLCLNFAMHAPAIKIHETSDLNRYAAATAAQKYLELL